ncbi:MAG: hypothetical protein KA764_19470, partial [Anaerolineales bacterium]|nr:hypothetical protein [Anaerolineales bacterium]
MTGDSRDLQLGLQIDLGDEADPEELDQAARQLRRELAEAGAETVELVSGGPAAQGAKSVETVLAGMLALTVLPPALPHLILALQQWTARSFG